MRKFLIEKLTELGVDPELIYNIQFVTDNGADIKKALEMLRRFYCITHALNISLRGAMSVKYATVLERVIASSPEAEDIITCGNEWVKQVRVRMPAAHPIIDKKKLKCSNFQSQGHLPMLKNIVNFKEQVCV